MIKVETKELDFQINKKSKTFTEFAESLKDKYLLDNSFKNSTTLIPNKKRF